MGGNVRKKIYMAIIFICIPLLVGFVTSRYGPWWGFKEQASVPDTPSDGVKIYADSNNNLYSLHENGSSYKLNVSDPNGGLTDPTIIGTLSLGSGSITDSSGAISFGDENLTTSGKVTITTELEIPHADSDVVLDETGEIFYDESDDQFVFYDANSGELVADEVALSPIKHISIACDPGSWYDSDTEIFLFTVGDEAPSGYIIDEWKLSCNVDPDVEIDADLRYADDWITLANAADIDELDTTNGVSSEDYDPNINSGNAIANSKVVYLSFDADPEGTCTQMIFEVWYHAID